MSEGAPDPEGEEKLRQAVELREARDARWKAEGERPLWRNLSMIGALGWLIVTPTLLGVFLGRWLDRTFDSGITWTGALIVLGVSVGAWLAWRRVIEE